MNVRGVQALENTNEFLSLEGERGTEISNSPVLRRAGGIERLLLALLGGGAVLSAILFLSMCFAPLHYAAFGILIDPSSSALLLLVQSLGFVTFRFSIRYLDGEENICRFLQILAGATAAASLLILSTDLILILLSWLGTSLCLHHLLLFYAKRPEAFLPAHKKFCISRLGDVFLIAAIALIYFSLRELDLNRLQNLWSHVSPPLLNLIAVLVVLAALTKSAQFPFHSWLPETMESPTPVSAFMHAGIVNAGGVVLLKFSSLLILSPLANSILIIAGTLTMSLGLLSQWAQVKVKRALAWSTIAQMGFMMVEIGLGAFTMALFHIVGHGFYKAWHFLWSSDLAKVQNDLPPGKTKQYVLGVVCALSILLLLQLGWSRGDAFSKSELCFLLLFGIALANWFVVLEFRKAFPPFLLTLIAGWAFSQGVHSLKLFSIPTVQSEAPLPILILPVLALLSLGILQQLLMTRNGDRYFAFRVAALQGFYLGTYADYFIGLAFKHIGGTHGKR